MPTSKPTKKQLEMMALLRLYHWRVWVPDSQIASELAPRGLRPTRAEIHAARRVCFVLLDRALVEGKQDGCGGWSFRLTRACREVLR